MPPGHGEQQDRSPSRGLLAPRVRWGEGGWTDASGLGWGVQAGNVTGIITGRKRKGQVGHGQIHAGDGGLLEATQSQMYWPSEAQLHFLESESEVAQSCPTLCDPMDCSPPGSSVHGIFQARVLEWVAISFSRGSSQPKD